MSDQFIFSHRELIEALIKQSNIHDGLWALSINFNVGIGLYGPAPDQVYPGGTITVQQIGITRHVGPPPAGPGQITVDASKVNPKRGAKASGPSKAKTKD